MDDKERRNKILAILPPVIGTLLILLAIVGGTLIARRSVKPDATPEPTSKVIVIPARTPGPVTTPTVTAISLYAYGAQLGPDGFTAYVGDKAVKLTAVIDPQLINPPVIWSFSDPASVSLVTGDERLTCTLTALKPSGKTELTVSCYGLELTIPVYLWER